MKNTVVFLIIDLNNSNIVICKTCDYKLLHGNNLKKMYSSTLSSSVSGWISHRFVDDTE